MGHHFVGTAGGVTANAGVGVARDARRAGFSTADQCARPAAERPALPLCPELDCVRERLPPGIIAAAELRAAETGVGADRALIAADIVSEEAYVAALTAAEGFRFEPLEHIPRAACPLNDEQLIQASAAGMLRIKIDGAERIVVAPRALHMRNLIVARRQGSELTWRACITTSERFQQFVARQAAQALARRSSDSLRSSRPDLSACGCRPKSSPIAMLATLFSFIMLVAPTQIFLICNIALGFFFSCWAGLRIFSAFWSRRPCYPRLTMTDGQLPIYTIIVALYREAGAVKDLVSALRRLDYPKEKLQIIVVLEPDDRETCSRFEAMRLAAPFEIVIAPASGPRTKPKALNAALPFARGAYVAVYDAEDRPEPDQLRRALDAFAAEDDRLACVQASLTIDNTADSWLTRMFTAEYAGLFDVFLPRLATWRMPLPLGGSSNHFRAEALRLAGAWDPYNVTEDADLGMRLARLGYRTGVIASTTYEEAPARFGPWLRQRTRWFKGWLQVWLVHMRAPRRLWRELGPAGFFVFQLLAGGSVLAALAHPLFLVAFLRDLIFLLFDLGDMSAIAVSLYGGILAVGYLAYFALGIAGLARRGLWRSAWALLLMPLYWLLLSAAAWRALHQLVRHPFRWEKTEHGLARTSRLTAREMRRVVRLRDSGASRRV